MIFKDEIIEFENKAKEMRKQLLDLCIRIGETHIGGCLSEIEILISLYCHVTKNEDKFILSKGHACHPMYLLLKEKGYNPKITPHPDLDEKNNVFCTTGSLGHGFPIGVGMAMARKKLGKPGRIFVLMGDGECEEGTTWESALIANHNELDNLTVIVDRNGLQALDSTEKVISLGNLLEKFSAFGWSAIEVDGHSFEELIKGFEKIEKNKPRVIIANTIKGKGISYMEKDPKWHTRIPDNEEFKKACEELK
jgi:transketolase